MFLELIHRHTVKAVKLRMPEILTTSVTPFCGKWKVCSKLKEKQKQYISVLCTCKIKFFLHTGSSKRIQKKGRSVSKRKKERISLSK